MNLRKRALSMLLSVAMVCTMLPTTVFAMEGGDITIGASNVTEETIVCENHTAHDEACNYIEAEEATPCAHLNEDGSYSCAPVLDSGSVSDNIASPSEAKYACDHSDDCGYAEAIEGADCTHECELCKVVEKPDCTCPPVDSGEPTHSEDCPLYEAPEQTDAVKNVLALISTLPTMAELEAQSPESAEFPAYLAQLRANVAAVRAAYDALTAEEKVAFDANVLAKLTALEDVLTAMPVLLDAGTHDISTGDLTLTDSCISCAGHTVSGTSTGGKIIVASGTHDITLNGVNIDVSPTANACAFDIQGTAVVNLTLAGTNVLKSGNGKAGLQVPAGAKLTISGGTGDTLTATGDLYGAGIGGGERSAGGTVTISGGNIKATGNYSAGIGGGLDGAGGTVNISGGNVTATGATGGAGIGGGGFGGAGGTVTISGGNVTANGGANGAGIGGASDGVGGTVNISGGNVTATGGEGGAGVGGGGGGAGAGGTVAISGGNVTATGGLRGAGIGGGDYNDKGTFSTSANGTAFINSSSISGQSEKDNWNGVIFEGNSGAVYGNQTLTADLSLGADKTLTIGNGTTLTVPSDTTLTNDGTITIAQGGTLTNNGTIVNNGTLTNDGTISGSGTIKTTCGDFTITGGVNGTDYSYASNTLTVLTSTPLTISGTTIADKIVVQSSITANITPSDVNIDMSGTTDACAFDIQGTAEVNLTLAGTNVLKSGAKRAGLQVPAGATVTIGGNGKLNATGGAGSAGIGGSYNGKGGTVNIRGGNVTANGGTGGAGIGCGEAGEGGDITITGGNVKATSTDGGKDTGGGKDAISPGTLTNGNGAYIFKAVFTEPSTNKDKLFFITKAAGIAYSYDLSKSTAIGDAWYVYLPEGAGEGTYDSTATYTTTVKADHTAVFALLDTTAPALTAGNVSRTSDSVAAVKFTSDEAGTYYYNIGSAVTDTTAGGTACNTSEQTISVTGLTTGAKDIYIVVKDAAGNISVDTFEITVPAYVAPVKTLSSIAITAQPTKTTYTVGESFDEAGMVVTAAYSDNSTATVTSYTVSPNTALAKANTTITITYAENGTTQTATQAITVADAPATVTSVTVSPATANVQKDSTGQFTATVTGTNNPATTVTWAVTGATAGTSISTSGLLALAGGETATSLIVTATATADTSKSGTATVTVTHPTHTITFDGNGGTASATTMQTGADGKLSSLPTVSRSSYTFNGWFTATSGGTSITTSTVFTQAITVYAQWSYQGGGGSSGGGSSSGGSTVTTPPATPEQPNPPTDGSTTIPGKPDKDGNVTVTVPDKNITDAINAAKKQAGSNGISVTVNIQLVQTANSLSVTISKAMLDKLVAENVKELRITSSLISFKLDLAALKEMQKSVIDSLTITITKQNTATLSTEAKNAIGNRPAFDFKATYANGSKSITNFGAGLVSVTIPHTLQTSEVAGGLYAVYVDGKGKVSYITSSSYDAENKVLRFSTNHFSVYGIGYKAPIAFTDIADHWAKTDIEFVVNRGLMSGTGNTTFAPNSAMTRGMFVTALGRLAGVDVNGYKTAKFADVKTDTYYAPYVNWAAEKGIVNGATTATFAPDKAITRQEMAIIMSNYAKALGYQVPKTRTEVAFADNANIGSWAAPAVKQMQMAGILNGKDSNKFDPTGTATRGEISAMLHRYVELVIDHTTTEGWTSNDSGSALYYQDGKALTGNRTVGGKSYSFNTYSETSLLALAQGKIR